MNGTSAYVLIQTDAPTDLADTLMALPGVVFAENVRGPYDALALARPDEAETLDSILDGIRALPGVIHALPAPLASERVEEPLVAAA